MNIVNFLFFLIITKGIILSPRNKNPTSAVSKSTILNHIHHRNSAGVRHAKINSLGDPMQRLSTVYADSE